MPTLSQGTSFSFRGAGYTVTSVSVDGPQPEIVNMSGVNAASGSMIMVPTGAYTNPGRISVEGFGFFDPLALVGTVGQATFTTPGGTITRQAVCDSASVDARLGQLLSVRITLMPTDYYP